MGRDTFETLRKAKELREKQGRKISSEHLQPVITPAGPPKKIGLLQKAKIAKQALQTYNILKSNNYMPKGSWKTSLFGVGGLATIAFNIASMYLDGDASTNPDWSVFLPAILASTAALFARDNDKSSQDVGLRK